MAGLIVCEQDARTIREMVHDVVDKGQRISASHDVLDAIKLRAQRNHRDHTEFRVPLSIGGGRAAKARTRTT